ncbi:MAG: hypothetical protein BGN89_14160 [Alphaproteobacteria bacterium 64-6]|nr:hypothetical protein [Hyphomicrobium sp.]OJU24371.1 MAG: hypothetical protein BGN89_14160 [Alphaproteobacteria bacterium 64-6]
MTSFVAPLLFFWLGLLFGVSFVATPAKFLAPSLQLPQALDVGRWTFHVLTLIEWGFVLVAALLVWACRPRVAAGWGWVMIALVAVAAVLALETVVVRPILDARVLDIIAGRNVAPNILHEVYIGLEALKLLLILTAAIASARWTPVTVQSQ